MDKAKRQEDLSSWLPTYGLVTAERILERFNINLSHQELVASMNDPDSLAFLLLRVPLKNVFNGIILEQARDYQTYAQKLYVDYLLSGEGSKDPASPGGVVREDLELERQSLLAMSEEFDNMEFNHKKLISESQEALIQIASELPADLETITDDKRMEVELLLSIYIEKIEGMNNDLRNYRSLFYNLILRVTEFMRVLPDYFPDLAKQMENRSSLFFDSQLGEA